MSRCHEWNSAREGFANYISMKGIKTNPHNFKVEDEIINDYCRINGINGSFSERVLKIQKDFNSFRKYVNSLIEMQTK